MKTFVFTFFRSGPDKPALRLLQQVTVQAADSKQAWKTFEAVYPFKRFTAFGMQTLN